MGLLDRLLGRSKKAEAKPSGHLACPHTVLAPHWDQAEDIGHEDRATSFVCDACHERFTAQEARVLRQTEAQRLEAELDLEAAREA